MGLGAVPAEQSVYARWLDWGTRVGLLLLIAAFAAYSFGLIEPHVPLSQLPALWGLPADRYLALTGSATGWNWVTRLGTGDYLNMLAIAILASITAVCYLRVLPMYFRRGQRLQAWIAVAQVVVLVVAASGALAGGH